MIGPSINIPDIAEKPKVPLSKKTYAIDFEKGKIKGEVKGREALEQFIIKAINTPRYEKVIYSPDYGCEVKSLIGKGFTRGFMESEIERMVREAILFDERVEDVNDFSIRIDDESIHISFTVDTVEGFLEINEVI